LANNFLRSNHKDEHDDGKKINHLFLTLLCFAFAQMCVAQSCPVEEMSTAASLLPIEVFGPKASVPVTVNLRAWRSTQADI
jgi:hypothetical protein